MLLSAELDPIEKGEVPMLTENEQRILAWFLRDLMPVGMQYNKRRFSDFLNFLCHHLKLERAKLVAMMQRPQ
jgi:hypothetical protein